jgi:type II secretory pathway pseudopilin PulG
MKKETQIALAVAVIVLVVIAVALLLVFTGGSSGTTASNNRRCQRAVASATDDYSVDFRRPSPGGITLAASDNDGSCGANASAARPQFTPRRDPFAPLPEEVAAMQADAFDPARYFVLASPPKPPRVELPEPFEPQPRRRVAGIIIGTTVSAILEQEGELPRIVYPGDMVGEFRVAAITETGLILRRSKGNPREVRVPYEPPGNVGGGGGGGAGFGGPRGGGPGAPPGAPGAGGLGAPGGGRGGRDLDI